MNREILFRGKRLDNGQWIYGFYSNIKGDNGRFHYIQTEYSSIKVDLDTVGQYTGAIDKNGNKIFEGDFLYPISKRAYLVFWDADKSSFSLKNNRDFRLNFYPNIADYYEVVGNIHDNPELLKGGEK